MKIPRPVSWRAAGAPRGVLVAVAFAALAGCQEKQSPGVFLEFRAENDQFRPEAVRFTWMRAGAELVNARLPQDGVFTSTGPVLGSIFIETDGPLGEPRLLAVKGMRGDTEAFTGQLVSGAVAVVPASAEPVQRWAVRLEEPLADQNGDGKPDVVQRDCLHAGWRTCLEGLGAPRPAGPPDDGGGPQPIADGGTPADTAAPADTGPVSVDSGLIGYWKLDEGSGTLARDSSGQGNNGSLRGLQNSAWMPGKQRDRAGDPQRRAAAACSSPRRRASTACDRPSRWPPGPSAPATVRAMPPSCRAGTRRAAASTTCWRSRTGP